MRSCAEWVNVGSDDSEGDGTYNRLLVRHTDSWTDRETLDEDTHLWHWGSVHSWRKKPGSWRKWPRWRVDSVIGWENAQEQSWPRCTLSPLSPPE